MSAPDEIQILLSPEEEDKLAAAPEAERAALAEQLLSGRRRPAPRPIASPRLIERTERIGVLENPRLLVVGGLTLVAAAGLIVAGTLIPEAIHNAALRVACAIGLIGLVAAFFGLAALYVASGSRAEAFAPRGRTRSDRESESAASTQQAAEIAHSEAAEEIARAARRAQIPIAQATPIVQAAQAALGAPAAQTAQIATLRVALGDIARSLEAESGAARHVAEEVDRIEAEDLREEPTHGDAP